MPAVALCGIGLHSGEPAEVRIARSTGPIVWSQRGAEAELSELRAARTDLGVRAETADQRIAIDSVEHLLAAIGGLGVRSGIRIDVIGSELPLLDGGARLFCEALFAVGASCGQPSRMVVARRATLRHESSTYTFTPPHEEESAGLVGAKARLEVEVSFPAPVGRERASWSGDPAEFFAQIAPARTFGWERDRDALLAKGRARGADLRSVIVFGPNGTIEGCRPNEPGEIARHKLLDLAGDLALHGGPPRGSIEASAPGHTATHAIVAEALGAGVLALVDP